MIRPGAKAAAQNHNEIALTTDGGVTKTIKKEGTGETIPSGSYASVHYIGRLADGSVFDESRKRKQPFVFCLGKRNVILGWDIAVQTMKIGEVAVVKCAPDYAYGKNGIGPIPPNSTLFFEIELLESPQNEGSSNLLYVGIFFLILTAIIYVAFDRIYPKIVNI